MAAMSLFTAACVNEVVPYEKGEGDVDGCYGVYFPVQEATGPHTYDPSQDTEVVFTVARANSVGAITVPVSYTESHEGIFQVGQVKFEDGQSETTLTVTFPESANGVDYKLSLAITDPQYASKYADGDTYVDFSVLRVEWKYFLNPVTNEPAVFTFNETWWDEVHTGKVKYYEVDGVRTCVTETDPVETADGTAYGFWGTGAAEGEGEISFTWYTKNFSPDGKQLIALPPTPVFVNGGELVSAYDYYSFYTVANPQAALAGMSFVDFAAKYWSSYPVSYYDGNGGIIFNIQYYIKPSGSGWYGNGEGDTVLLADGFIRTDYSLDAEADYAVSGVTPVTFEAGADVATIKYVVVEGEANVLVKNEQVAAIVAGTAENVLTLDAADMVLDEEANKLYATVDVTCPQTGKYTLIAVSFDADGKEHASASVAFDYVAADDDSYEVTLNVEVADTPERFAADKHTVYNSFMFTVYGGNELTDVKIGLYETATVTEYGLDAVVAELRYEDEETNTSVLADTLARINTTIGYTDLFTGLKDNTSYTMVVWGTNGMQTKVVAATYQTEENPEVFKSLGMAQYTDDIVGPMFSAPNISYEVEIQESVDNPGKYRLVNPYGEAYPYNEPGDWDASQDYYLVINAQNPNQVYIDNQPLGLDWGMGMMYVYSYASYYMDKGYPADQVAAAGYFGTLENGVITFPVKGLLFAMPSYSSSMYYANQSGAFKVVLPGYGEETPEEGTETTSVSKASVINAESAFDLPMSVGHIVGAGIQPETRTVEVSATVSANLVRKASGRDVAPTRNFEEVNF